MIFCLMMTENEKSLILFESNIKQMLLKLTYIIANIPILRIQEVTLGIYMKSADRQQNQ